MIIDMKNSKVVFNEYVSKFNLDDVNIKGKKLHSFRVMDLSNKIARSLNLDEEKIQVSTLIGLLHDIARFEQYTNYKTFCDYSSFDHGDYALNILDNNLRQYIKSTKYDRIIKLAIKNHNKLKVEGYNTEEELMFCNIIRDADKLDILYEAVGFFFKNKENEVENGCISKDVKNDFDNHELVHIIQNVKYSKVDFIVSYIAYIYDINYRGSFEIIKREDYINKIINRFNYNNLVLKHNMIDIEAEAKRYIEQKIN